MDIALRCAFLSEELAKHKPHVYDLDHPCANVKQFTPDLIKRLEQRYSDTLSIMARKRMAAGGEEGRELAGGRSTRDDLAAALACLAFQENKDTEQHKEHEDAETAIVLAWMRDAARFSGQIKGATVSVSSGEAREEDGSPALISFILTARRQIVFQLRRNGGSTWSVEGGGTCDARLLDAIASSLSRRTPFHHFLLHTALPRLV